MDAASGAVTMSMPVTATGAASRRCRHQKAQGQ